MKQILITGGAGFIGSHLAEYLLKQGAAVHVLDDLSTGSRANLASFVGRPYFRFTEGSATDEKLVESLVREADHVFHLAASVGVRHIIDHLVDSITNNVRGTEVVLAMAARFNRKVLLTSTSEVYGRDSAEPFVEQSDLRMGPPAKTRWSYACSKALDEYLAFAYYHETGLPVVVARLFNTVGERQTATYGMVLPTFVQQALSHQPLTVYGDGRQSRCFCHVSDVVAALVALMEHPASVGQVFNIGSIEEVTIDALADRVISLLGSRSQKINIPYEEAYKVGFDDIARRVPNIDKIKNLIGFETRLDLDGIILRMAESMQPAQVLYGKEAVNG